MRELISRWRPSTAAIAVCLALTTLTALVLIVVTTVRGDAVDGAVPGNPVPTEQVAVIATAGLSCPALSPARLAGQIMGASGFRSGAPGGAAGLSETEWARWSPWPGADLADPAAGITALAHLTCDLAGQVRAAGLGGDLWEPAVAARRTGLDAVSAAQGVPDEAAEHVRLVSSYAAWYAERNDQFAPPTTMPGSAPAVAPSGSLPPAVPVPDDLVEPVRSGGRQCPAITPHLIAAQLMAASGFRRDLAGENGAEGIAQFLPELWSRYGAAGASPKEPAAAIAALATAMCSITASLGGIAADPYAVALQAFHTGPGTTDKPADDSFVQRVLSYAPYYADDRRLDLPASTEPGAPAPPANGSTPAATPTPRTTGTAPAAAPAPPAGTAPTTTKKPSAAATKPAGSTPTGTKPTGTKPANAAATTYMIKAAGGRCVDVPRAADGTRLRIWSCAGDSTQRWVFAGDGSLRNSGLCMDLSWAGQDDGTPVQLATCNGGWAQKFTVNGSHDLVNTAVGKCVDVVDAANTNGAALQLWTCTGGSNQKWSRVS